MTHRAATTCHCSWRPTRLRATAAADVAPTRDELETLFEGAPRFVDRLVELDASTWVELFDQAEWIALTMPQEEELGLLDAHSRIEPDPPALSACRTRNRATTATKAQSSCST